jgi:beta-glucosidase
MASPARAAEGWDCARPETPSPISTRPAPRSVAGWTSRVEAARTTLRERAHPIVFLGDSLMEGWSPDLWATYFAPRGAINLGFAGDRTEHLLWRLTHGHLDGPPAKLFVVLIGTNNAGHGHPVTVIADGIRETVATLRRQVPDAKVLLLGLLPRSEVPSDPLRIKVGEVNGLVAGCADGKNVVYAEIGQGLLDRRGLLTAKVSPDRLHFNHEGYDILSRALVPILDRMLQPSP